MRKSRDGEPVSVFVTEMVFLALDRDGTGGRFTPGDAAATLTSCARGNSRAFEGAAEPKP